MKQLSIIMPVFNEASTFAQCFEQVYDKTIPGFEKEIIIIESNSTDGSRDLARSLSVRPGVKLILQDKPLGKGFAVRSGFEAATGDIILIQDADLEYDVNDYDKLIAPIDAGITDFVLGSRHLGSDTWKIRNFACSPLTAYTMNMAHQFFTATFNLLYRQRTTDPATMYKVFRRSCLNGIEFQCNRFDFDFELVCRLCLKGFVPLEVPVSYTSRGFKAGKKVRFFRDPITWVQILIRIRLQEWQKSVRAGLPWGVKTVSKRTPDV